MTTAEMESMKLLIICFVSSLYFVLAKLMQEQYTATHPHLEVMVRITKCSSSHLRILDYKGKNTFYHLILIMRAHMENIIPSTFM